MTLPDFIDRFVEFAMVLANALVCALAAAAYQKARRRCLLLVAVSAGLGAVLAVAPWVRADEPSWGFWGFYTVAALLDLALWVLGVRLLLRDYTDLIARVAQGGPATPSGHSGVTAPPSPA